MYKRCFLHIMPSSPPTYLFFFFFFCFESKDFCCASRRGDRPRARKCVLLICPKGGELSPRGARPEAQRADLPDTSLILVEPLVYLLSAQRYFQCLPAYIPQQSPMLSLFLGPMNLPPKKECFPGFPRWLSPSPVWPESS